MKKILAITAIVLPFLVTGCLPNETAKTIYQQGVYYTDYSGTGNYQANELFIYMESLIKNLNVKYEKQSITEINDENALADFTAAVAELSQALKDYQEMASSGKDFGESSFSFTFKFFVTREAMILKESDSFTFEYIANTRITALRHIDINTRFAEEVFGEEPIQIADFKIDAVVDSFKLFNEDGTPSDAGFVIKVEPTSIEGFTAFKLYYHAKKGVNPGKFYLLITFHDKDDPSFVADCQINIEHVTE